MLIEIFIFLPLAASFEILNQNLERSQNLADFAANVVENECKNCKTILVITTGQELSCDLFFKKTCGGSSMYTVTVDGNGTEIVENTTNLLVYKPELTIIFLNIDVFSVDSVIFSVELLQIWNIRGKFLVLYDGEIEEEEEEELLKESFEIFWEYQALRVLILIWKSNSVVSYTFDPFRKDYKIVVNEQNILSDWFHRKITNMHEEPIKLYQYDLVQTEAAVLKTLPNGKETWVGPDGMFFSTLVEYLNATILNHGLSADFDADMVQNADPSLPFSNYFDLFFELFDFDLIFNRMQTFSDNYLDHIFLYERDDWYIILPKSGIVPQYLHILLMVSWEVWTGILLSLMCVIIIRQILGKKNSAPVLDNLSFLLGTSAPCRHNMRMIERLVLATWTLVCVVIVTLFQTTLMSTLIAPKYYPNIDTLEELMQTNVIVFAPEYTHVQIKRVFKDHKFMDCIVDVPKNLTVYGDNLEWIDPYKQNYGLIMTGEQLHRLQQVDPLLFVTNHIMAERAMPNAVSYNIPQNKLYFEEVLKVFGIIQEAGLHYHWRNYDYFLNRNFTKNTVTSGDTNQKLTIFHLQSAFMLLGIGLTISTVVFCCEFAWYKITKKLKR